MKLERNVFIQTDENVKAVSHEEPELTSIDELKIVYMNEGG